MEATQVGSTRIVSTPVNLSLHQQLGWWSALLAMILGVIYSVFQLASVAKVVSFPLDLVGMFLPSLLLAPLYLVVLVCLDATLPGTQRPLGRSSIAFGTVYCALVTLVYFTQLATVIPAQVAGRSLHEQLLFKGNSLMVAIDCLGYGFMSLSALVLAPAFYSINTKLFYPLLFHGLLLFPAVGSFFFPALLFGGALWMISFPWAMAAAMKHLRKPLAAGC